MLANPKFMKFAALILVVGVVCRFCYVAGENSEKSKWQQERIDFEERQKEVLRKAIAKAKEQQKKESQIVIDSLKKENQIEENIRHVESQIHKASFACDRLPEFMRLFNEAIPD